MINSLTIYSATLNNVFLCQFPCQYFVYIDSICYIVHMCTAVTIDLLILPYLSTRITPMLFNHPTSPHYSDIFFSSILTPSPLILIAILTQTSRIHFVFFVLFPYLRFPYPSHCNGVNSFTLLYRRVSSVIKKKLQSSRREYNLSISY